MYATRKALGTAARALSAAEPGAWALRPSGWCSSRRRHLFTGGVQRDKRPLVIALDLDETLVHSYFGAEGDRDLRQREARPEYDVAEVAELVAEAADSAGEPLLSIDVDGIDVTVAPRPGLRDFFAWLHHAEAAGVAEAWMFTSAQPRYATRVLAALQHVGSLPRPSNGRPGLLGPERRLFRADCTMRSIPTVPMGDAERETGPNVLYLKDLRTLLRADARRHKLKDELISTDISENERNFLERVVLVDNSPVLCLPQPDNGIPIGKHYNCLDARLIREP